TRIVAVNFPNNPTGAIATHAAMNELVAVCRDRGLLLLSDEVYRGVERDAAKRLTQAADIYERALSLNVTSKAYGLPGLRVGWIATRDSGALARMAELKHYLSICNSAPSEVLATIAIKAREQLFARNRDLIADNLRKLGSFFSSHPEQFDWYEPDGGCVAFPRYRGPGNVEDFCRNLLNSHGVLLLPASLYSSALAPVAKDRFRIGFGRRGIDEALNAFTAFLHDGTR
ncbi:MAG: pyridoxal phosphate-dependent aminotransferase, partial [Candidatus Eremiobacteraeota bacterium]|nr:pyridoxal phosphate-dependent aminotransferase [Candidatus Eremiobacteraeota bacterium]